MRYPRLADGCGGIPPFSLVAPGGLCVPLVAESQLRGAFIALGLTRGRCRGAAMVRKRLSRLFKRSHMLAVRPGSLNLDAPLRRLRLPN